MSFEFWCQSKKVLRPSSDLAVAVDTAAFVGSLTDVAGVVLLLIPSSLSLLAMDKSAWSNKA